jgi:hypothetical protein
MNLRGKFITFNRPNNKPSKFNGQMKKAALAAQLDVVDQKKICSCFNTS